MSYYLSHFKQLKLIVLNLVEELFLDRVNVISRLKETFIVARDHIDTLREPLLVGLIVNCWLENQLTQSTSVCKMGSHLKCITGLIVSK